MRSEIPREREYYPGPAKKQRVDYGYPEPERRPVPKPAQKTFEPRPAPTVVIEKRPVIFNAGSKNVADYPPLPQRKPVQKPTKAAPQAQPVRTVEKQPPKPFVGNQQTKAAGNQQIAKPVGAQQTKPVGNQITKPVVGTQITKPVVGSQAKPVGSQAKPVVGSQAKLVVGNQTKPVVGNQQTKPVVVNQQTKPVVVNQQTKPVVVNQQTKPVAKQVIKPIEKQPLKSIQTTPSKPVPQKQLSQVVAKGQDIKTEPVKIAEAVAPTVEPCPEGYSQLNGPMSQALSEELKLIADAISEELPKQAPTPAERYVVKKMQTDVIADLRNVLGLNVTKRLLNLHNPLYVKLLFSGKPEPGCLQPFLARHKLCEFKRIESPGDTFAARLDCIADFDRLCEARELACGSATVTVKPCYKFLACPPKLKTIYGMYMEPVKAQKPDSDNPSKENTSVDDNQKTTQQEVASKVTEDSQSVAIKLDKVDEAPKEVQKVAIKKEVDNEDTESNNENVVKREVVETRKTLDNNTKIVSESPVKVNITIQGISKKDIGDKDNTKDEVIHYSKDTKNSANKINAFDKSIEEVENTNKEVTEDTNVCEEEMNDKDILALMSGGIVLDECSGSEDDEK